MNLFIDNGNGWQFVTRFKTAKELDAALAKFVKGKNVKIYFSSIIDQRLLAAKG